MAGEYEIAYNFFCENDIFAEKESNKRIEFLNESINLRKKEDDYKPYSGNQRQIAARYFELAEEYVANGNNGDALPCCIEAATWGLNGLQMLFAEGGQNSSKAETFFDTIIIAYQKIIYYSGNDSDNVKRAQVMVDVITSIMEQYVDKLPHFT